MFRQGFSDESWNSLEKVGSAQADSARAFILDVMGSSDEEELLQRNRDVMAVQAVATASATTSDALHPRSPASSATFARQPVCLWALDGVLSPSSCDDMVRLW